MKNITIQSTFQVFDTEAELPKAVISLMQQAKNARLNAYAPYSNFTVGAAVQLDNGNTIIGNNQENASYPSGLCAERTAIYFAGAKYPKSKIIKIAITAGAISKVNTNPIPPCGACRQAIAEYEVKQNALIEIYFMGTAGKVLKSNSLKNLLPLMFTNSLL